VDLQWGFFCFFLQLQNMSHRVSHLSQGTEDACVPGLHACGASGTQRTGGEQRAKRGVSRLAVLHIYFSIKTLFAAPLLSQSEVQLHASGFCCTAPEIDTVKVTAGDLVGLLGKVVESSEATVKI